jgi:hypothetical protein
LSLFGDPVDEVETVHEVLKLKSAGNGFTTFRPVRHSFQVQFDFFGGKGRHIF